MSTLAIALCGRFGQTTGVRETSPVERPNRIEALRLARGWSMAELAARCDPPTLDSTINKLEKGQRKLTDEWKRRIAGAFGVTPYELTLDAPAPLLPDERAFRGFYRALDESRRHALFEVAAAMAGPRRRSGAKPSE
jgi:transcriptional regulator with XRE-family HTH domain